MKQTTLNFINPAGSNSGPAAPSPAPKARARKRRRSAYEVIRKIPIENSEDDYDYIVERLDGVRLHMRRADIEQGEQ